MKERTVFETKPADQTSVRRLQNAAAFSSLAKTTPWLQSLWSELRQNLKANL
jgi:hypothetical protein